MEPYITIQSSGPVTVHVAPQAGGLGLHVPPGSTVTVIAADGWESPAQFAARASQSAAAGVSLPDFAAWAARRAAQGAGPQSDAVWAAQRAELGETQWQFAEWAAQRAARRAARRPRKLQRSHDGPGPRREAPEATRPARREAPEATRPARREAPEATRPRREAPETTRPARSLAFIEARAQLRARLARFGGAHAPPARAPKRREARQARGYAQRFTRSPSPGTPEYVTERARLDTELEEYMRAGGM
jgi:hypothetical protein